MADETTNQAAPAPVAGGAAASGSETSRGSDAPRTADAPRSSDAPRTSDTPRTSDAPRTGGFQGGPRPGGPRPPRPAGGPGGPGGAGGRKFFRRKKVCKFTVEKIDTISYRDVRLLQQFVSDRGKIIPRRLSGTSAPFQRKLTKAIKRARAIALLPYAAKY
jgi:small subunit ribosomal protein S18